MKLMRPQKRLILEHIYENNPSGVKEKIKSISKEYNK